MHGFSGGGQNGACTELAKVTVSRHLGGVEHSMEGDGETKPQQSSEVSAGYEYEMDKSIDANVCNNRSYICDNGSGRRCDGKEEELR